jgi:hypothetical protein
MLVFIGSIYTISGGLSPQNLLAGLIYCGAAALVLYANFIPYLEADGNSMENNSIDAQQ